MGDICEGPLIESREVEEDFRNTDYRITRNIYLTLSAISILTLSSLVNNKPYNPPNNFINPQIYSVERLVDLAKRSLDFNIIRDIRE